MELNFAGILVLSCVVRRDGKIAEKQVSPLVNFCSSFYFHYFRQNTSSPYTDQGEQASPYTDNPNISSSANPTRTHFMQHALQSNEDQKHFDSNFA